MFDKRKLQKHDRPTVGEVLPIFITSLFVIFTGVGLGLYLKTSVKLPPTVEAKHQVVTVSSSVEASTETHTRHGADFSSIITGCIAVCMQGDAFDNDMDLVQACDGFLKSQHLDGCFADGEEQ